MKVERRKTSGAWFAGLVEQPPIALGAAAPPHRLEHLRMAVLEGDVEVRDETRLAPHQAEQLDVERGRIGVQEANPGKGRAGEQGFHQPQQPVPAEVEVLAVAGGVLGDQAELDRAGGLQGARLGDQALDGPAAEAAAPVRDRAEGAGVVAAFGDLEIGVAARRQQAGRGVVEDQVGGRRRRWAAAELDDRLDLAQLIERDEAVDLRNLPQQLLAVAVDHATRDQELRHPPTLARCDLEDGVDRLPLGLIDEGAGVDDHGLGPVEVGRHLVSRPAELAQEDLRVHQVLGAAQADQADARGSRGGRHGPTILPNGRTRPGLAGSRPRAFRRASGRALATPVARRRASTRWPEPSEPAAGAATSAPAAPAARSGSCRTRSEAAAAASG